MAEEQEGAAGSRWREWSWRRLVVLNVGVCILELAWFATSYSFERSVDAVGAIFDNSMPNIALTGAIQGTFSEVAVAVRRIDDDVEVEELTATARETDLVLRSTRRLMRQGEGLSHHPDEVAARDELHAAIAELTSSTRAVVTERDAAVRRARIVDAFYPSLQAANAVVHELQRVNAHEATRSGRSTLEAHEGAVRRSFALTLGLNCLLVVLWVLLGRQVARTERERERRIEELDAFGGRVAHDLKGPLSTILMSAHLMRKEELAEGSLRSLDRIERAGLRMDGMIEGLLEFAKAGATHDVTASTPVAGVLASLQSTCAPVLEAERVQLTIDVEAGLCARTTEGVLSSIAQNLVRNAVIHLGEAPVRQVRVRARTASPTHLQLEVSDTGPGIPDDVKRRLFRPFERGSTVAAGHGLGLATVKRLADGHGGEVTLESEVGRGSTFRVRLPRA